MEGALGEPNLIGLYCGGTHVATWDDDREVGYIFDKEAA